MRPRVRRSAHSHALAFCAGFILGAAMMASPSLAVVLGLLAALYILAALARR